MSEPIIRVENLGKCYRIHHESRERYTSLRDVIAKKVKGLFQPSSHIPHPSSDEDFWALKDVSFEVNQGDVVGIIGRNGAGKSTLLKILSRITEPTKGRITLNGRIASLLEVGTGFHPELTGRENIYLNGAILSMTKLEIKIKFDEIVAFAEVERFLDTPVKRYSSGMYVRLAFAVAAHLEPEILVVDEVLAVGDAEFQKKCLGKMQEVSRGGRTVLFVSHNMSAVRSLCASAMLLDGGRLKTTGAVSAVTDLYLRKVSGDSACSISTEEVKRPGHLDPRAKITSFSINNGTPLLHGLQACFLMSYIAYESMANVAFTLSFSSPDGTRIMSVDSDIPGSRFSIQKGTRGEAMLKVDKIHLAPTSYALDIGIRSGDSCMVDYLPSVAYVSVLPSDATPPVIAMRSTGHGGVRYPCVTTIKETPNTD